MIKEVIKCTDCPFFSDQNEYGYVCNAPESTVDDSDISKGVIYNKLPINCPLLKNEVIVKLK